MKVAKRGRGRPLMTGEATERYQVTLPPSVAERIRAEGGGSLSRGIWNISTELQILRGKSKKRQPLNGEMKP